MKRILGVHVPPADPGRVLWLRVLVWTAVVYAAVPFARVLQRIVESSVGAVAFTLVTLVILVGTCLVVMRVAWHGKPAERIGRLAVLVTIGTLFAVLTLRLRTSPEEALHFVEYGVLAILVLRAMTATTPDRSAYLSAAAVCVLIGAGDEVIQWLVPSRFFDFRDIGLNALASLGVLVAVRFGVNPAYLGERSSDGLHRAARLWICAGVAALLLFANTPSAVQTYTTAVFPLRYLRDEGAMADYGVLHTSDGVVWKSRFSLDDARALDGVRADELAEIQAEWITDPGRGRSPFTRAADPFAYELVAHSRALTQARATLESSKDGSRGRELARTVLGEDAILQSMFPRTTSLSGAGLSPEERAGYGRIAEEATYVSLADHSLITSVRQKIMIWLLVPLLLVLAAVEVFHRTRRKREAPRHRVISSSSIT